MVWAVAKARLVGTQLDLSSAGLGRRVTRELLLDDEVFCNAVDLVSWGDEELQVVICPDCGTPGCHRGDWVRLRGAGDHRLFVPCLDELPQDESDWEGLEPPSLVARRGAPLLVRDLHEKLCATIPGLPANPQPLTPREALQLAGFEAPPGVSLQGQEPYVTGKLLTCADHDVEEGVALLEKLAASAGDPEATLHWRPREARDEPVTFYLDDARFSEWTPLVRTAEGDPAFLWDRWISQPRRV